MIWNSVALSARYIVQVIFLHAGQSESSENYSAENIILHTRRFATKLAEVSDLIISSEHLWDFDLTAWMKKDVQERNTIQMDDIPQIVTAVRNFFALATLKNLFANLIFTTFIITNFTSLAFINIILMMQFIDRTGDQYC